MVMLSLYVWSWVPELANILQTWSPRALTCYEAWDTLHGHAANLSNALINCNFLCSIFGDHFHLIPRIFNDETD